MSTSLYKFYNRLPNSGRNALSTFIFGRLAAICVSFDLQKPEKNRVKVVKQPGSVVKKG